MSTESIQLKKVDMTVSADETVKQIGFTKHSVQNNETYDGIDANFATATVSYHGNFDKVFRPTAAMTFKEKERITISGGRSAEDNTKQLKLSDSNGNTVVLRADP